MCILVYLASFTQKYVVGLSAVCSFSLLYNILHVNIPPILLLMYPSSELSPVWNYYKYSCCEYSFKCLFGTINTHFYQVLTLLILSLASWNGSLWSLDPSDVYIPNWKKVSLDSTSFAVSCGAAIPLKDFPYCLLFYSTCLKLQPTLGENGTQHTRRKAIHDI